MTTNIIIYGSKFVSLLIIVLITFSAILFAENQKPNSELLSMDVYRTDLDGRLQFKETIQQLQTLHRTQPEQMPGWPQNMGTAPNFAPTGASLADIDDNSLLEILAGSTDGSFHVWDFLGNELIGWPKTGLDQIQSKCAVGDIDPAYPGLEIVAAGKSNTLYAWHNDGTDVPGWPQYVGETGALKSPVIYDLDNDGSLEIILGQRLYPNGHVLVFNSDGTTYLGWPQSLDYMCVATPSVGDVDNDGEIEICAVSFYSVFLWDKDGVTKPGWPKLNVAGGMSYAQPVFADLDDDGDMEILHSYYTSNTNYVGI
ncbi:MAG: VCBS repeat-containing protein, partial [Candidatus Cloacimonetes bacterium]|nr:VCBS repeat-containing protein [Candidatus Cloacimonadota bacterium]